jgi:DNA anti-recombination protein RmuC
MMAYLTEFLHNPVTMTIAAGVFLLVLLTALVFGVLLARQRRSLEQLQDISDSLSHLQESFVRTNLNLESVANRLQNLESQYTEFSENYEHSKVELARLAEAMGGENQLTKAIDLARGGASAEEITLATGLGEDEASAIVKFHGSPKR